MMLDDVQCIYLLNLLYWPLLYSIFAIELWRNLSLKLYIYFKSSHVLYSFKMMWLILEKNKLNT